MKRFYILTLLVTLSLVLGCGGGAVENPEVFDEETLRQVEENDQAVMNAEMQQ